MPDMTTGADETGPEAASRAAGFGEVLEMLRRYPTAVIMALNPSGLLMPLPRGLPMSGQRVLEGRSLVDSLVFEDRSNVARAWFRVRAVGSAQAPVRLISNPDSWVQLYLINLLVSHGLVVGIIAPEGVDGQPVDLGSPVAARSLFASYRQDDAGVIVECDGPSAAMLGFKSDQLVATQGLDLVHPDDQPPVIDAWLEAMATKRPCTIRYRHARGEGGWLWVDGTIHNYLGQEDRDEVLVELIDVSEAMAVKEALESRELLLNRLTEALPVGVLQIDGSQNVLYSNERLHQILGAPATGDLRDLLSRVDEVDRESLDHLLSAALRSGAEGDLDIGLSSGAGELRRCLMSVRALTTKTSVVAGAIVCVSDTTDSVRMRRLLEDRATFDVLTRCYNRASVMSALKEALAGEGADGTGVIFIDLDRFKPVNDQFGHAAGDELLIAVAGRIRGCLRDGDCLGRIGGDEFLIVCQRIDESDELLLVARRICDSVRSGFVVAAHAIDVGVSIGLAFYAPGITADDLVAVADDAMYQSKRQGKSAPVLGRHRMGGARHHETLAKP